MNLQEIFETVVAHLRKQNAKAQMPHRNACYYREESGKMCAVGCLIRDDLYHSGLEYQAVYNYDVRAVLAKSLGVTEEDIDENIKFFSTLQRIHDSDPVHSWEERFQDFASYYSLTVPEKV